VPAVVRSVCDLAAKADSRLIVITLSEHEGHLSERHGDASVTRIDREHCLRWLGDGQYANPEGLLYSIDGNGTVAGAAVLLLD
jgi:hypothetical protein